MAGRTAQEAAENYLRPLQRSISCIAPGRLNITGRQPADEPHLLVLGSGGPTRLKGGLGLTVEQRYRLVEAKGERGPWKVSTAGYAYALDADDGREIVAYHWHPAGRSSEKTPHLHLGAGAEVGNSSVAGCHLPTGRVSLEAFLRILIVDFGVQPQRVDWESVLADSRAAFEKWGTWGTPPAGEAP